MTTVHTKPRGMHLVGSLAFDSAEEVFREVSATLGDRVQRIPDGETGPRAAWVGWQQATLAQIPELEQAPATVPSGQFKLREGVESASVDLGTLGYSDEAEKSYATFERLKNTGRIPPGVRFQVSLPTPFAGTQIWLAPGSREALADAFENAMRAALIEILDTIPHDELAIQWDVCLEIGYWERPYCNFTDDDPMDDETRSQVLRTLGKLGDSVPDAVELGFHLCYGDWGHEHFIEPQDAANLVVIANGILEQTQRPVNWMHLPVPRDRADDAYFEPLADLRLRPETELYLGLVHYTDGVEGTERRIEAAQRIVSDFGVATECGMGRREGQDIQALLAIHREVCAPLS